MASTSQKLNINEERVKKFLNEQGYDLSEAISYGEFLDLIKKMTGTAEIPFILSKTEKYVKPDDYLSFFDFLPLICKEIGCESNRSNPPKRIYMPLIEIIEKMMVYSKWCPYCIQKIIAERSRRNNEMMLQRLEDQEIAVDMNIDNANDKIKLVKRGRAVEAIEANTPFINSEEAQFFNDGSIKRTIEIDTSSQENEFVAVTTAENPQGNDVETVHNILTEPTDNPVKYKEPSPNVMLDDNLSFDEKVKEIRKRYAMEQLEEKVKTTDDDIEVVISDVNRDDDRESIIQPTTKVVKRRK